MFGQLHLFPWVCYLLNMKKGWNSVTSWTSLYWEQSSLFWPDCAILDPGCTAVQNPRALILRSNANYVSCCIDGKGAYWMEMVLNCADTCHTVKRHFQAVEHHEVFTCRRFVHRQDWLPAFTRPFDRGYIWGWEGPLWDCLEEVSHSPQESRENTGKHRTLAFRSLSLQGFIVAVEFVSIFLFAMATSCLTSLPQDRVLLVC